MPTTILITFGPAEDSLDPADLADAVQADLSDDYDIVEVKPVEAPASPEVPAPNPTGEAVNFPSYG